MHTKNVRGSHSRHALWLFIAGVTFGVVVARPGGVLDGYFLSQKESPMTDAEFVTQVIPEQGDISGIPDFGDAMVPVERVPDWGAMRTPAQWNRTFAEMTEDAFVPVPSYDVALLDIPVRSLMGRTAQQIPILTAKLFYSTRFMGTYDLDAGEFSGMHPGIDLKLAQGTPVAAIGGGRVAAVRTDDILGLHVLVEHRHPTEGQIVSIYGHLDSVAVRAGDHVAAGENVGTVGMTGNTSAPHLHLQIDRTQNALNHTIYRPKTALSREEAARRTINPADLIGGFRL